MISDKLIALEDLFKECCEIVDRSTGRIDILSHYKKCATGAHYVALNNDLKSEKYRLIKHKLFGAMALDRIQNEKERLKNENQTCSTSE